ncbi:DUF2637 domain-containing protein [Streptomyces acidiscabies]|uniref:DUF2637 domain-containing protein n=1 Tax=Streptomyces acidiscabies TaxID=42234 RepID=A0AAP6BLI7_9ACTN|nr:DUF2637 domain-containing protein [Streptomyces acidiscabies]MBP5936736.1 DUF2637 domain-containing protein [Streptomyces sp. LBUM 1476]MBZ3915258.1 DUF2637 domain-containing protein [Streptomyces acidiscabies]MDX2967019.1 DUF2637 domain-containing protein [Streptomyces acidiscabies]MDX3021320.1 DUF2637 domain-containing protein [Streptomyces acidiscabies]MDX3793427.1 DUF2637 domain-containing protein [Streptomyces acidiscabies]
MNTTPTAQLSAWDRAAVIALGAAGCALSYDALRQMALAIHVRPTLTWLFPIVIDGFIAYGVRALLVLKDAPLRARLYVWALFGTATAASIWANALHAVRINQQTPGDGLHLGDMVVAVLSTIAPLALAGAVHLYILIARSPDNGRPVTDCVGRTGEVTGQPDTVTASRRDGVGQAATEEVTGRPDRPELTGSDTGQDTSSDVRDSRTTGQPADKGERRTETPADHLTDKEEGGPHSSQDTLDILPLSGLEQPADLRGQLSPAGKEGTVVDRDTKALLEIAREAVRAEDKLTRKVVAEAIRGQRIPLSNDTLTTLMVQLRAQHGQQLTTYRN